MPRDSSGNYTLPLGNPVIDGTVIDTNWANPTMSDIAVQLNNVLTRDGLLGPTGAFYVIDGTPALPGLAFASQHGTGLWKDTTQVGISYQGVTKQVWNATGSQVNGDLNVTGNVSVVGTGPYVKKAGDTMTGNLNITAAAGAVAGIEFCGNGTAPGVGSFFVGQGSTGVGFVYARGTNVLQLGTNNQLRMMIDATGNVGIGTVPPAWWGSRRILSIGQSANATTLASSSDGTSEIWSNLYLDSVAANLRYLTAGFGNVYQQNIAGSGAFTWSTAPSGAAGTIATLTERMRIDAAGNVYINLAQNYGQPDVGKFQVVGSIATFGDNLGFNVYNSAFSGGGSFNANPGAGAGVSLSGSGGPILFAAGGAERMRIDAGGNVLIAINKWTFEPASGALRIQNAVTDPAPAVNTGLLYVSSGQLLFKGGSGTVTVLAPA